MKRVAGWAPRFIRFCSSSKCDTIDGARGTVMLAWTAALVRPTTSPIMPQVSCTRTGPASASMGHADVGPAMR